LDATNQHIGNLLYKMFEKMLKKYLSNMHINWGLINLIRNGK